MATSPPGVGGGEAEIVLLDDHFASIVAGVEEGRAIFANMRKFTTYVLASNVPEIVPFLLYVTLPVPLALGVMQILAIDFGTDLLPAIGLGQEPPSADLMARPPRPGDGRGGALRGRLGAKARRMALLLKRCSARRVRRA
jgi:sodium/potassium-transporting ATPase subunit alpha